MEHVPFGGEGSLGFSQFGFHSVIIFFAFSWRPAGSATPEKKEKEEKGEEVLSSFAVLSNRLILSVRFFNSTRGEVGNNYA